MNWQIYSAVSLVIPRDRIIIFAQYGITRLDDIISVHCTVCFYDKRVKLKLECAWRFRSHIVFGIGQGIEAHIAYAVLPVVQVSACHNGPHNSEESDSANREELLHVNSVVDATCAQSRLAKYPSKPSPHQATRLPALRARTVTPSPQRATARRIRIFCIAASIRRPAQASVGFPPANR